MFQKKTKIVLNTRNKARLRREIKQLAALGWSEERISKWMDSHYEIIPEPQAESSSKPIGIKIPNGVETKVDPDWELESGRDPDENPTEDRFDNHNRHLNGPNLVSSSIGCVFMIIFGILLLGAFLGVLLQ